MRRRSSLAPAPREPHAGQHVRHRVPRLSGTVLLVRPEHVQAGQFKLQLLQFERERPDGTGPPSRWRRVHAAIDDADVRVRRPRQPARRRGRVPGTDARARYRVHRRRRPWPPRRHHRRTPVLPRQRVRSLNRGRRSHLAATPAGQRLRRGRPRCGALRAHLLGQPSKLVRSELRSEGPRMN